MKAKDCSRASLLVTAIQQVDKLMAEVRRTPSREETLFGQFHFGQPGTLMSVVFLDKETTLIAAQSIREICERALTRLGVELDT